MNFLTKLRRKFGRFGIDNLMLYVTVTMLAVYLMELLLRVPVTSWIIMSREMIFRGEIWRLFTFVFIPPASELFFMLIALYFFYFIGSSLENAWGPSSFTWYYLCGVLGTLLAGMISGFATNTYLNLSLFFAFAQLFPEQEVLLFFILPVKVKYLALVNWAFFVFSLAAAILRFDWITVAAIIASLLNFFLFFGPDFRNRIRDWRRYGSRRREFRRQMRDNDHRW